MFRASAAKARELRLQERRIGRVAVCKATRRLAEAKTRIGRTDGVDAVQQLPTIPKITARFQHQNQCTTTHPMCELENEKVHHFFFPVTTMIDSILVALLLLLLLLVRDAQCGCFVMSNTHTFPSSLLKSLECVLQRAEARFAVTRRRRRRLLADLDAIPNERKRRCHLVFARERRIGVAGVGAQDRQQHLTHRGVGSKLRAVGGKHCHAVVNVDVGDVGELAQRRGASGPLLARRSSLAIGQPRGGNWLAEIEVERPRQHTARALRHIARNASWQDKVKCRLQRRQIDASGAATFRICHQSDGREKGDKIEDVHSSR